MSLASAEPKKIILAGRSETKIKPVIDQIKSINSRVDISFVKLDLSDNDSVRRAAQEIDKNIETLDVLINCAGVMAIKTYTTSVDGFEMHLASNHLGHFLLTNLLMSKLIAAKGVVINVSSTGYTLAEVDFEDPSFQVSDISIVVSLKENAFRLKAVTGRRNLQSMACVRTIENS